MTRIDPTTWRRAPQYAWFRGLDQPYLAVTAEVDARRVASCGLPPFPSLLYVLAQAVNAVPELRQRIRVEGGRDVVVEHDRVHVGFTADAGDGLFGFAEVELADDPHAFVQAVRAAPVRLDPHAQARDDLAYFSCLPWVRFTHVVHPMSGRGTDTVPRIAFGRLSPEPDGAVRLPVNLQAHHALVDGRHVGQFFAEVQQRLDSW